MVPCEKSKTVYFAFSITKNNFGFVIGTRARFL